jgi:cyclophilin family peptidyl-prolyl cis-trans isomerase
MRCYLDLSVGEPDQYESEKAAYDLAVQYLQQCGSMLGLDPELGVSGLNDESKALLQEAFEADPTWKQKGSVRLSAPGDIRAGRLVLELFSDACPKTCENFRCLCTGERGKGKKSGKLLHYKGCAFHRIVKGFMMQGGDVVKGDGSGGDSIYGTGKFNDEKQGLKTKHAGKGTLAMANSGKNTNTSQFYITFGGASDSLTKLDGKHVVFGKVVEGLEALSIVESRASSESGKPVLPTIITDCGVL